MEMPSAQIEQPTIVQMEELFLRFVVGELLLLFWGRIAESAFEVVSNLYHLLRQFRHTIRLALLDLSGSEQPTECIARLGLSCLFSALLIRSPVVSSVSPALNIFPSVPAVALPLPLFSLPAPVSRLQPAAMQNSSCPDSS